MSASFTRSIQAITTQGYGRFLSITISAILLLIWLVWFFFAQIPLYETSTSLTLLNNSEAEATFTVGAGLQLAPEQPVYITLNDFPVAQYGVLEANVAEVDKTIDSGEMTAKLTIVTDSTLPLQANLQGEAEVEVATVSPMQLLLRTLAR